VGAGEWHLDKQTLLNELPDSFAQWATADSELRRKRAFHHGRSGLQLTGKYEFSKQVGNSRSEGALVQPQNRRFTSARMPSDHAAASSAMLAR
jgi:hypothetical protein